MIDLTKLWRFKKRDGSWAKGQLRLLDTSVYQKEDIRLTRYRYEICDGMGSITRVHIEAGEKAGFVLDKIITKDEVCVHTDFRLENKDAKTWCNVADKHRLVIRNDVNAMKHFRLHSVMDDKVVMDTAGLLMPYVIDSDLGIGYSMYEGLYNFGKEHFACFGYCINTLDGIKPWHFYGDPDKKAFWTYPKDQSEYWQLELQLPIIKIIDKTQPDKSMTFHMVSGEIL